MLNRRRLVVGVCLLVGCSGGNALPMPVPDAGHQPPIEEPVTPEMPMIIGIETLVEAETIVAGSAVVVHCSLIDINGESVTDAEVETVVEYSPEESFAFGDTGEAFATIAGPATAKCTAPSLALEDFSPAMFTIVPGPAHTITTSLSENEIEAGGSTTVSCSAVDAYGNEVTDAAYRVETSPSGAGITVTDFVLTVELAETFAVSCRVEGDATIVPATLVVNPGLPANIALSPTPDLAVYRAGDTVEFDTIVTDTYGNEIGDAAVTISRSPTAGTAAPTSTSFRFDLQGSFTVTATVTPPTFEDLAVSDSLIITVGGSGPIITCDSPLDGASVDHALGTALSVRGTATDPNGVDRVTVNGASVSVSPTTGSFTGSITPRFGMNFVELTATDDLGEESSTICSFLVADEWLGSTSYLDDGVALELHEDAIDDRGGRNELDSFGDILDKVVNSDGLIDTIDAGLRASPTFLPFECHLGSPPFCLLWASIYYAPPSSSPGVSLGNATVEAEPVTGGLRVVAQLENIQVRVGGRAEIPVIFDRIVTTTTGWVQVDNFDIDITFNVTESGGTPNVAVRSVNSISISGFHFNHFTNFFGDLLGAIDFIDFAGIIEDAISEGLGNLLENLLGDMLEQDFGDLLDGLISELDISALSASFDVPKLDGESAVTLSFSTHFSSIDFISVRGLFGLGTRFSAPSRYYRTNRGVPLIDNSILYNPPTSSTQTTAVAINVGLVNQVLHTLWRGGYFDVQIDPDLLSADALPAGLTADLEVRMPPVATISGTNRLRAQVGGARIAVTYPPLIPQPIEVEVGASLLVDFSIGGTSYTNYYLNLGNIAIEELHLEVPGAQLSSAQRAVLEDLIGGLLEDALTGALSDGLPAIPIPAFTIPASAAEFGLPAGRQIGLVSPSIFTSGTEHIYLTGNFGLQPVVTVTPFRF